MRGKGYLSLPNLCHKRIKTISEKRIRDRKRKFAHWFQMFVGNLLGQATGNAVKAMDLHCNHNVNSLYGSGCCEVVTVSGRTASHSLHVQL